MKKIYCPVNGWDCPYWKKDGTCSMREEEGVHPKEECDDYALFDEMFDGLDDDEKENNMEVKIIDITNMSETELVELFTWASENLFNVAVENKEEVTKITLFKES